MKMHEITRRDFVKLGLVGGVTSVLPASTGISPAKGASATGTTLQGSSFAGEQSAAGELVASPLVKTVHDLSKLSWKLSGFVPYLDELDKIGDLQAMADCVAGPIAAPVPGSVQMALLTAGLIKDWNIGLNARENEWVENRDWVYQVSIPDEWIQNGQEIRLHCAGLDYAGEIVLNGQTVQPFAGSFTPHSADLKPHLKTSGNVLSLRFTPPPRWLGQFGYTSRMKEWKPRFNYGWDWINRVVQIGIWDEITIEVIQTAEIEHLHCDTDVDLASGKGSLNISGSTKGGNHLRVTLRDGERLIRTEELATQKFLESGIQWADLPIVLWWPNGMGKQPLYDLSCDLLDDQGRLIDHQSRRLGFKHVKWRRTLGAPDNADPYLCVVNGKEVFLFGVDWTPIRPNFADLCNEDYHLRLSVYRDCGMKVLRVWGGGFLEKKCFYDYCDEMGLLVWQEFPLSSSGIDNYPPDDPQSIAALAHIAESYIDRRRHHVSLLLWCGGNEVQDDQNGIKSSDPTLTIKNHPTIVRLAEIVAKNDPVHHFLPTTPYGPVGSFNLRDCGKRQFWDVHGPWTFDGPVEGSWMELWTKGDAMFHSEMGAPSASSAALIRKYKGDLKEMPGTHQNPLWNRQPWWIDWPKFVHEKGREPQDLEEYVDWSQARQAAALTLAARLVKSRFPRCGGLIIWMGHDSFPCTANTSIVDFEGKPKPAAIELAKIFRDQ
jgi:beta-mannosidase